MLHVALLAALSGCSFLMMNNPAQPPQPPRCEAAATIPVIDVIGAVAMVALGGTVALAIRTEDGPASSSVAALGIGVGLGATFATSATIGFRRAGRCRRATDAFAASSP